MFEKNNDIKSRYQNTLKQINELSLHLRDDDDKIKLLSLINNLKFYASSIEPQQVELALVNEIVGVAESPSKTFPRVNEFEVGASYRH